MCRWARSSFGLGPDGKAYLYEDLFVLVENCNITLTEAWAMPVEVRRWWIDRKGKDARSVSPSAPIPEGLKKKKK